MKTLLKALVRVMNQNRIEMNLIGTILINRLQKQDESWMCLFEECTLVKILLPSLKRNIIVFMFNFFAIQAKFCIEKHLYRIYTYN